MRVLVIQHDHVSPPGAIGERFAERGYDVVEHVVVDADRFHTPDVAADFPDPTAFEAIVPMGAPWSAYDHGTIGSWLLPELDLLRMAHAVGVPVLGICFGGQLLATAHGGAVVRAEAPELGWSEVASDDERVIPGGPWFQWHYDRWQVPPGGRELARNAAASQAFVLGRNLALQFHPELDSAMLTGWLELGGDAKLRESGVDPEVLLHRTRERDAESRARAHRLVDGFCDHVATADQAAGTTGAPGTPGDDGPVPTR